MISDTLAIAAVTGGVCLAAQAWFTLLFARLLPDGPWRSQPAFAAHQAVALPLMILVSVLGCMAWLAPESPHATPHERIYGPCAAGEQLAAVLLGGLVLWDIPLTSLPSIYSPAAMGHHVVTSVLALLALRPYCAYYAPFFAGVIEISSVPLVFVDLFHPKHLQALAEASPALSALNGAARAAFAASFLVLRTACFPLVVFTQVLPDLASLIAAGLPPWELSLTLGAVGGTLALTALQWHWSWLLIRQLRKALARAGGAPAVQEAAVGWPTA